MLASSNKAFLFCPWKHYCYQVNTRKILQDTNFVSMPTAPEIVNNEEVKGKAD